MVADKLHLHENWPQSPRSNIIGVDYCDAIGICDGQTAILHSVNGADDVCVYVSIDRSNLTILIKIQMLKSLSCGTTLVLMIWNMYLSVLLVYN